MIICMSDLICVTNRKLCAEDFYARLEKIAACRPAGIILREKDLSREAYRELAAKALTICENYGVLCVLHNFPEVAAGLGAKAIHLPLAVLRGMTREQKDRFSVVGASCHSAADAREAQRLGCTYLTAGHVFDTDCKKGLPGRGLSFLEEVCGSVSVPVYAIGGISPENIADVRKAGAAGACVMSGCMQCADVSEYFGSFR